MAMLVAKLLVPIVPIVPIVPLLIVVSASNLDLSYDFKMGAVSSILLS